MSLTDHQLTELWDICGVAGLSAPMSYNKAEFEHSQSVAKPDLVPYAAEGCKSFSKSNHART